MSQWGSFEKPLAFISDHNIILILVDHQSLAYWSVITTRLVVLLVLA